MKMKFTMLESHPNDSRIKLDESGTCQSLTGRMGTGGGNVPMVIIHEDINGEEILPLGGRRYISNPTE